MQDLTTSFIGRLRARDSAAWFELWETFGPVLERQLARWGGGRIGRETVQDLSQETMASLASAIDRHDPNRGARFSTWLLAIARYTLSDELDRRTAQKRGGGKRAESLENLDQAAAGPSPDAEYELAVYDAKVEAALRALERGLDFVDFETFRMRVLEGRSGREVAQSLGTSEPTVSRRLARARDVLRGELQLIFQRYSFTEDELLEPARKGLAPSPNKGTDPTADAAFDEAIGDTYARIAQRRVGAARPPA
ncbi:MAG: sigma-70 family RNA polymerase sigma factor [Planctomycetota bacterium]